MALRSPAGPASACIVMPVNCHEPLFESYGRSESQSTLDPKISRTQNCCVATTKNGDPSVTKPRLFPRIGAFEVLGILVLGLMATCFLAISWRRWPDPIVDIGPQWYAIWRVADGARLYHEFIWNYGPLSITFNAWLFRLFGPGMMVLVTANLVIYGLLISLAYVAFRKAWGRLAAFSAVAVFISVFSFSRLVGVGGYDFATPYTHESTHGLLLMLVTAFLVVRWAGKRSLPHSFLLGLCGGLAAVMKPEFMLAGGLLGIAALILRRLQRQPVSAAELSLVLAGIALPTLFFTASFARFESWSSAFAHASHAWWVVVFSDAIPGIGDQQVFSGLNQPWQNAVLVARITSVAVMAIGAIWAAGWFFNRSWSLTLRWTATLAALALAGATRLEYGWFEVGRCFPVFIAIGLVIVVLRLRREMRQNGRADDQTVMALALVVLAGAMMARMVLFPRVYHFGFYQGAFAGMVLAAMLIREVPMWTGAGMWGRRLTAWSFVLLLGYGCLDIARQSRANHAGHTIAIGSGADRFYGFDDETTSETNWALERLRPIAPEATVFVLQSSLMINYLSRHISPFPDPELDEAALVKKLDHSPPDYVVLLPGNLPKFRVQNFGAEGQWGYQIIQWLREHYAIEDQNGKTTFLRHKVSSEPSPNK